jgi:hypothetical protein
MDLLNQIIDSMKKEECRHFKLYASRSHAGEKRKDILLFDYIKKKGQAFDEDEIRVQLYGPANKNAFYRLKHRLLEELNKSLWLQHFNQDELTFSLYLFSLAKLHFDHDRFEVSFHYLKRAEREAISSENFEILDLIYGQFIRLSYAHPSVNPENYIQLRKQNREKLEALNSMDDLVAAITYRIKVSSNHNLKDHRLLDLLQKTVDEYANNDKLIKSPKVRIKIYDAVSKLLLQRYELEALATYLLKTYTVFHTDGIFTRQTHKVKLQMLVYLVNTHYLLERYQESLVWTSKLKDAMEEYGRMHYDAYLFFYYNGLIENYSVLDDKKALDLLIQLRDDPSLKQRSFNRTFIFINAAAVYYNRGEVKKALRSLIELFLFDEYQNADLGLKLRVEIFELIIRFQMEANEVLKQRLGQVRKDYGELLETEPHWRDLAFLDLLSLLNVWQFEPKKRTDIHQKLTAFLRDPQAIPDEVKPIFDYDAFVQNQLEKLSPVGLA